VLKKKSLNLNRPDSIQRVEPGLCFSAQARSTGATAHLHSPPKLQAARPAASLSLFLKPILQVPAPSLIISSSQDPMNLSVSSKGFQHFADSSKIHSSRHSQECKTNKYKGHLYYNQTATETIRKYLLA